MLRQFIIIAILGIILYLPSLFGPFLWDDEDFVYANKYVENFQVDKFFTDSATAGRGKISNYYRPVQLTIYSLTHAVFGFNPFWFHLINVLIHIAASCAVFYFFYLFLGKNSSLIYSWLIALLFLVHPVQTEAVSYISGLGDPLFVFFGILCLISFLKSHFSSETSAKSKKSLLTHRVTGLLFYSLALLSKETALVFLPLLFLLVLTTQIPNSSKAARYNMKNLISIFKQFKLLIPYVILTILYLLLHFTYINKLDMVSAWGNNIYTQSIVARLLTFVQNLYTYVGLLLFPKDLFLERDYTVFIQTNPLNQYFIIFILVTIFIVFILHHFRSRLLFFCFLGFFISFLSYTGLVLGNGIFYEHFLYLPLIFFFAFIIIVIAILSSSALNLLQSLFSLPRRSLRFLLAITAIIYFLVLITRNIFRQFEWTDSVRFYSQTLDHAPQSIRVRNGLAMAYAERGQIDEAIREYQSAIRVNPSVPNLYHNLANAYLVKGLVKAAEENYFKAIEADPRFFFSYQSLVNLYQQTGQKEKLQEFITKYQKIFP